MSWMLLSLSTALEPLPCHVSHFADAISSCTGRSDAGGIVSRAPSCQSVAGQNNDRLNVPVPAPAIKGALFS
jgi:hypothetical protein